MEAGVIIEAKIGAFRIVRAPLFRLAKERRQIALAELRVHDADYALFKELQEGDTADITFGYRDGQQAVFTGEVIVAPASVGSNITRLLIAGDEYALARTFVSESYNDETPSAIVKLLAGQASIAIGTLNLPEDPIGHIIFNDISIWAAFAQLREMMLRNGYKGDLDYWFYQGRLHWGIDCQPVTTKAGQETIISHSPSYDIDSTIELPLIPLMDYSEMISIDDARRGVSGSFRINAVTHLYQESMSRTYAGYKL